MAVALTGVVLTAVAIWMPSNPVGETVTGPMWLRVVFPLLLGTPLAWRRRAPLASYTVILAVVAAQALITADSPEGLEMIYAMSVGSYSVATYGTRAHAIAGLALGLAGYAVYSAANRDIRSGRTGELWAGAFFAAVLVAAWLVGTYVRYRRDERRMRAAAALAGEHARAAVEEERARLARDMHDVIAHNLSVVVVQAAGARAAGKGDPATLAKIENSGRESLTEMRRLLGVLRRDSDDEPPRAPRSGITDLGPLVERVRAAGVPVELSVTGDATGLPAVLDLCAYRIVQESLTNVLKHAGRAAARVDVRCEPDAVTIDVVDDGAGPVVSHTPGHGLIGMRERVAIFDGQLSAGAGPDGGFAVHARLPRDGSPS
jgi:signal transduction histidine kinase